MRKSTYYRNASVHIKNCLNRRRLFDVIKPRYPDYILQYKITMLTYKDLQETDASRYSSSLVRKSNRIHWVGVLSVIRGALYWSGRTAIQTIYDWQSTLRLFITAAQTWNGLSENTTSSPTSSIFHNLLKSVVPLILSQHCS